MQQTLPAGRGDGQLEEQLVSRLQKTERRRKALQRKAGASDSPRGSERSSAGSPEHRPRTPSTERTGGGEGAHDMNLSPWAASADDDSDGPPPLMSPRELVGGVSTQSHLMYLGPF